MYQYPKLLNNYLLSYKSLGLSKQLKASLLRFEDLYQPSSGSLNAYKLLPGYQSGRQYKKSLVYLTNKDLVKTFNIAGEKSLLLTSSGKKVLFKNYPLQKLRNKKWDGKWVAVSYDISSDHARRALRRKMLSMGFGTLHYSLMVCPLPVEEGLYEYIKTKKLLNKVLVLKCERVYGLEPTQIASTAFNLVELNNLYLDLLSNFETARTTTATLKLWNDYFLAVNYFDPYLPYELLPNDWAGDDCISLYKQQFSLFERILAKIVDSK